MTLCVRKAYGRQALYVGIGQIRNDGITIRIYG